MSDEQIKREYDFLTQPGGGNGYGGYGWKFRPLYEAFIRLLETKASRNKKYVVTAMSKSGGSFRAQISLKEAKRLKSLMKKKFFFTRKELYVCVLGDKHKARVKLNMREFPIFELTEINIETNPLEDNNHYDNPDN